MNKIVKNAMILTAITVISGFLLGLVYEVTKAPIAQAKENAKIEAYREVLADADEFTAYEGFDEGEASSVLKDSGISACTINEVVVGTKNGESVGCVITVTDSEGYGGEIQFAVGIDNSGVIKGISFLSIAESPGLGMNAKDDPTWKEQYYDKEVASFSVVKGASSSDSEISALSGATISSKAITAGVNAALCYYNSELGGAK